MLIVSQSAHFSRQLSRVSNLGRGVLPDKLGYSKGANAGALPSIFRRFQLELRAEPSSTGSECRRQRQLYLAPQGILTILTAVHVSSRAHRYIYKRVLKVSLLEIQVSMFRSCHAFSCMRIMSQIS